MSNEQPHSPQHNDVLKKQALEQNEVKEVLNVFRKYGTPVLIGLIVVCGAFLFVRYRAAAKVAKEAKADSALMHARSAADFEDIVDEYGSTASAPIALMSLAMTRYSEGNYDAAEQAYGKFLKEYDDHEMALLAELNAITCREAKGAFSEAHLLYGEFAAAHPDSYLAPVAKIGQGRCLEAMGSRSEAKRAYEDLVVSYPGSSWASVAETRMKVISSKLN